MKNVFEPQNEYYVINEERYSTKEEKIDIIEEGHSIYEVIRIINGEMLFYKEHEQRMVDSCELAGIEIGTHDELRKKIEENCKYLLKCNDYVEGNIKVIVTVKDKEINIEAFYLKHSYPSKEMYEKGVRTVLIHEERNNPNAKIVNETFKERVNKILKEENAYEGILINRHNNITEGTKSNLFFILKDKKTKQDTIVTSKVDEVLPGITRMKVLEVIRENGMVYEERDIFMSELEECEGAFITGTSPCVLPIREIGNLQLNSCKNETILNIMKYFEKKIEEEIKK